MLLWDRRRRPVLVAWAGMEMAWFTPLLLLVAFWSGLPPWPALPLFLLSWGGLLAWLVVLDLLNTADLPSPRYRLAVLGALLLSSLLAVRALFYPELPLGDLGWLSVVGRAFVDWQEGPRRELILLLANAFLWQRAASATGRERDYLYLRERFRTGLLLLAGAGGLLTARAGRDVLLFVWLYVILGLAATVVARANTRRYSIHSPGQVLKGRRFAQLLALVGVVGLLGVALGGWFTPERTAQLLTPVWVVLSYLLTLLYFLFMAVMSRIAQVVVPWLLALFESWFDTLDADVYTLLSPPQSPDPEPLAELETAASTEILIPEPLLRVFGILFITALIVVPVLLVLRRMRPARREGVPSAEEVQQEPLSLGGLFDRLGAGLRDAAGMVRRFGLSRELLDAISVQNAYANLCRLAARRGYPRPPALPPDRYLRLLEEAFPGHAAALAEITAAYMRVHYGDQSVDHATLTRIRERYAEIREAPHAPRSPGRP
ncbi:MAG: DUF4129 domain-containing protein [Anaerolineales bacterium]